jgi:hypothetical protein
MQKLAQSLHNSKASSPLRLEFHHVWNQQRTTEKRRSNPDHLSGGNQPRAFGNLRVGLFTIDKAGLYEATAIN